MSVDLTTLPSHTSRYYWPAQGIFWGGYGLVNLAFIGLAGAMNLVLALIFGLLSLLLLITSHWLRSLYKKHGQQLPLSKLFAHLLWLLPLLALTVQLVLHLVIYAVVHAAPQLTEGSGMQAVSLGSVFGYSINTAIMLLLWSIVYLLRAELIRRRNAEVEYWRLQAELKARELDFLRGQINSHFLFNALNNLRALIREDAEAARQGLADLSTLLRGILQADSRPLVTLEEELAWVRGYLALEALQLDGRLQTELAIDDALLKTQLPPMLMQTLVENAIKHGIAARRSGGLLRISAQKQSSNRWQLCVENPPAESTSSHQGNGVGLRNLRERLQLAFGERAHFELQLNNPVHACVEMPL